MTAEVFANSPTPGEVVPVATLAADVTNSATSFPISVALPASLQSGGQFHALIDSELVVIPTQSGTALSGITRAVEGSTATAHLAGAGIFPVLTAGAIGNALSSVAITKSGVIDTGVLATDLGGVASGTVGVVGGVAALNDSGQVIDASGTPIIDSGGGARDYSGNADTLWVGTIADAGGTEGSAEGSSVLLDTGVYPYSSFVTGHVTIEDDPTGGGFGNVLTMAVASTDDPAGDSDSEPRADIESPALFTEGSDLYCSIRPACPNIPYLVDTEAGDQFGFFNVAEIYGPPTSGPPSIALMANAYDETDDVNHWAIGALISGTVYFPWVGPAIDGQIHEFTLHVVMSSDAGTGLLELWMDGEQQTFCEPSNRDNPPGYTASQQLNFPTFGPNQSGGANFLNLQHYRTGPSTGGYSGTITTYHATAMIGSTYASVQSSSNGGASTAANVTFDPTGLEHTSATNVQDALADYDSQFATLAGDIPDVTTVETQAGNSRGDLFQDPDTLEWPTNPGDGRKYDWHGSGQWIGDWVTGGPSGGYVAGNGVNGPSSDPGIYVCTTANTDASFTSANWDRLDMNQWDRLELA